MGGQEAVSAAEASIIRRIATLTVELERLELDFASTDEQLPAKLDQYQRCANTLRRLLEAVGLKRRAKNITPTIESIAERAYFNDVPTLKAMVTRQVARCRLARVSRDR
jgi:hypothetical protein